MPAFFVTSAPRMAQVFGIYAPTLNGIPWRCLRYAANEGAAAKARDFSAKSGAFESIEDKALCRPITLYIQLPGYTNFEGIDFNGVRVHHLKDAIIAKFKLDVAPQQLQLFKLHDDGSRTLLDPMQTLSEAGLRSDTKLVVVATFTTEQRRGLVVPFSPTDAFLGADASTFCDVSAFVRKVWTCDIDSRVNSSVAVEGSRERSLTRGLDFATPREAAITRQARLLRISPSLIRQPLPLDTTTNPVVLMPQLLESRGSDLDRFADVVAVTRGSQEANVIIGSAASGVGKTHLAYAWGMRYGCSILGRAITSNLDAKIAPPFLWLLAQLQLLKSAPSEDAVAVSDAAFRFVRLTLLTFVHFSILAIQALFEIHPAATADDVRQLLLRMHRNGNADALVTDILDSLLVRLRVVGWPVHGSDIFVLDSAAMRAYEAALSIAATSTLGEAVLFTVDEAHELMERRECQGVASLFLSQRAATISPVLFGLTSAVKSTETRSVFYAVVLELSSLQRDHCWSTYVTGTALSMRRVMDSSSASVATRCHPLEFAPEHRLSAPDIVFILRHYWAIDDVLADPTVSRLLGSFVGRPQLFVAGVFKPLFDLVYQQRRVPTALEFAAMLSLSYDKSVLLRKRFFIDIVERNSSVAIDGSGTAALLPLLFKAAVMDNGLITLSSDDQLAGAICTGLLAVSSTRGPGSVNMREEPIIYESIRAAVLDPHHEGRILDILMRSSQHTSVFAKGGALETAISWHVALTCSRFTDPSLAELLRTLGVDESAVPPDLASWVVRATRVHDDRQGWGHSGASSPTPFLRYFFDRDGNIDDSRVVFNIPLAHGGDVAFLVSRVAPVGSDAESGTIYGGRQYKLVVLQCKNAKHATVAEVLLTLHPGTQFLQNSARQHLLCQSDECCSVQDGWHKWEALSRDAGKGFLTRNWVRVAVVARSLDDKIIAFSLAAATSDTSDAHVLSWSVAQRRLASLSPVIWVSFAREFKVCAGVFADSVRAAIIAAGVAEDTGTTESAASAAQPRHPRMILRHHKLWVPASVGEATNLVAPKRATGSATGVSKAVTVAVKRRGSRR